MKGRHVSKKTQRKLLRPRRVEDMSIKELVRWADAGDENARRMLRRLCGTI